MLVKYKKIEERFGNVLILDKEYEVLEVYKNGSNIQIRLICEDNSTPIIAPISLFNIADTRIPPDWNFDLDEEENFTLNPSTFNGKKYSFWEDYFDGGPELEKKCEKIVEKEVQKIKDFHFNKE